MGTLARGRRPWRVCYPVKPVRIVLNSFTAANESNFISLQIELLDENWENSTFKLCTPKRVRNGYVSKPKAAIGLTEWRKSAWADDLIQTPRIPCTFVQGWTRERRPRRPMGIKKPYPSLWPPRNSSTHLRKMLHSVWDLRCWKPSATQLGSGTP